MTSPWLTVTMRRLKAERRRAEAALAEEHQFSERIIRSAQVGIIVYGPDLRYQVWNPYMERLTGMPAAAVLGRHPLEQFPFLRVTGAMDRVEQALAGAEGEAIDVPYYIASTGRTGWIRQTCSAFRNAGGEITGVLGMVVDITGSKQAEAELQTSEARFRALYEASPLPIQEEDFSEVQQRFHELRRDGVGDLRLHLRSHPEELMNLAGRVRTVGANPAALRLLGAAPTDPIARMLPRLLTEASLGAFREEMGALFEGSLAFESELPLRALDGRMRQLFLRLSVMPGHEATLARVLVSFTDLTERKRNAQALLESDFFFRESQRAAAVGSYKADFVHGVWKSSEVLDHIFGIDFDYDRTIDNWLALIHPGDREMMASYLRETVIAGRQPFAREYRIIRRNDGETRWVKGLGRGSFGPGGAFLSLTGTIQDITERKQAEEALRASEQRYRNQFNRASDGICSATPEGEVIELNESFARMHGYRVDEMKHMTLRDVDTPESYLLAPERTRRLLAGESLTFETEHLHKDGHIVPMEVSASLVDSGGKSTVLCFYRDITERRALNDELERRVKERTAQLEAANRELEAFSYSVSHDLRAPLRGVDGFSQVLLEDYQDRLDETARNYLGRIRQGAQRMGQLIEDLLKLSHIHRQDLNLETIDLSGLCALLTADLARSVPERRTEVRIQPGLSVRADARLLRVMLENLLGNAWKFTAKCSGPRIEVGEQVLAGGDRACYVRDNGAGFDMAFQDKLFQAFQRLHAVSEFEGTGIGLAIVQRIINRHGGRVWAESEPGRGATFFFTLPD